MPKGIKGFQKGHKEGMCGKHHSEETKKKMSETAKKKFVEHPELKTKIGNYRYWLGKKHPHSEKAKRKISESKRGTMMGTKNPFYGKGYKLKGNKNGQWQGGKSFEPYSTDWTETLRISIRERDHYICQLCKKLQGDRAHSVHHIDYEKRNCNPDNLITLCISCNNKVNLNRDYWKSYWQGLVNKK